MARLKMSSIEQGAAEMEGGGTPPELESCSHPCTGRIGKKEMHHFRAFTRAVTSVCGGMTYFFSFFWRSSSIMARQFLDSQWVASHSSRVVGSETFSWDLVPAATSRQAGRTGSPCKGWAGGWNRLALGERGQSHCQTPPEPTADSHRLKLVIWI